MKKASFVLYSAAIVIVFIPIAIVLVTGKAFTAFYSNLFIYIAMLFVIEGLLLEVVRKAKEEGAVSWSGLGIINGLLLMILWDAINR